VKYIISGLITVLILPSIYFAYLLIEEKKYQHQIDLLQIMNFQIKELPFCIRKPNSIKSLKNWNSVSYKRYSEDEKGIESDLKSNDIKDTKLTVMQDTTDLKSDILSEINFNKSELSQKMFQF
jgi:hypothetical protein